MIQTQKGILDEAPRPQPLTEEEHDDVLKLLDVPDPWRLHDPDAPALPAGWHRLRAGLVL